MIKVTLSSTANKKIHGVGEIRVSDGAAEINFKISSVAHLSEYSLKCNYQIYGDRIMLYTTPGETLIMNMFVIINLRDMYPAAYYSTVVPIDCGFIKIDQHTSKDILALFQV
jgi:hypothetical protein